MLLHSYLVPEEEEEEEEEEEMEEESLFKADAVNEEDPERDRATQEEGSRVYPERQQSISQQQRRVRP